MTAAPARIHPVFARWQTLPRTAKWAILAALGMGLYFGVVEPVLDQTNTLEVAADLAEAKLREYDRQEASRAEALDRIAIGSAAFGSVQVPAKDSSRVTKVSEQIGTILTDHGVVEWNVQTARGSPLGRGLLPSLYRPDAEELQKFVFTVTLTDRQSTVLAVIADLERIPEIAAINTATLRRAEKGKDRISATLSPEVWVVVPREASR